MSECVWGSDVCSSDLGLQCFQCTEIVVQRSHVVLFQQDLGKGCRRVKANLPPFRAMAVARCVFPVPIVPIKMRFSLGVRNCSFCMYSAVKPLGILLAPFPQGLVKIVKGHNSRNWHKGISAAVFHLVFHVSLFVTGCWITELRTETVMHHKACKTVCENSICAFENLHAAGVLLEFPQLPLQFTSLFQIFIYCFFLQSANTAPTIPLCSPKPATRRSSRHPPF